MKLLPNENTADEKCEMKILSSESIIEQSFNRMKLQSFGFFSNRFQKVL